MCWGDRDCRLDYRRRGLFPLARLAGGELGAGDCLHQPVHLDQPVSRLGGQRVPAQRRHCIPGRHWIIQQRPYRCGRLRTLPFRCVLPREQQAQRHWLGRQECQQSHQPCRRGGLSSQPGQREA